MTTIKTSRLILRPWKQEDFAPFAALNADPRVREYFPSVLNQKESDASVQWMQTKIEEKGWGFWAVSAPGTADFIGFIGLSPLEKSTFPAPFTPAVEIGWRLAHDYWGKGYATEGALAALDYGFKTLHLDEIVAFTAVHNTRSRHVMKTLGMHHNPEDDFDHPKVPDGNPVKRQVLYRLGAREWESKYLQRKKK